MKTLSFFTSLLGGIVYLRRRRPLSFWRCAVVNTDDVEAITRCSCLMGQYASLLELRNALLQGTLASVEFERNGSELEPTKLGSFAEVRFVHRRNPGCVTWRVSGKSGSELALF